MSLSKYAPAHRLFDWLFVFFAGWSTLGIYIDGWAHIHLAHELETFFTPWHAFFYTGVLFSFILMLIYIVFNHWNGYKLRYALPKEYMYSFAGLVLMIFGGMGDLTWHSIFGIESGFDALFSPTHLILAIGGAIAVSGPLYAIWFRYKKHPIHAGPTILSTFYFLSIITFMLQFLHPFAYPWMAKFFVESTPIMPDYGIMLGIAGIIVFTVIIVTLILSTLRHWLYPPGSFTVIMTLHAIFMTAMNGGYYEFVATGFVAGVVIDLLYWILIVRRRDAMSAIHLFSFLVPFSFTLIYMMTILWTNQIVWSIHTWTGSILLSGIVGYLISYLMIPPDKAKLVKIARPE